MAQHVDWIQQSGNHTCLLINQSSAYLLKISPGMTILWDTNRCQPLMLFPLLPGNVSQPGAPSWACAQAVPYPHSSLREPPNGGG